MFSKYLNTLWQEAYKGNDKNILNLLDIDKDAVVLDVGCGDGQKTIKFKTKIESKEIFGVDGVKERLDAAKKRGIKVRIADLEKKWPFEKNEFNVVVSNQVIEHIVNLDHFIGEIYRILKPGGYCVISTENLSSWHNIFALISGNQDFSHHLINKIHVGNPMSLHYKQKTVSWSAKDNSGVDDTAYPHMKIMTFLSLIRIFESNNFKFKKGLGSGYYPLPGALSKIVSSLDPYHSHFISVKLYKPLL